MEKGNLNNKLDKIFQLESNQNKLESVAYLKNKLGANVADIKDQFNKYGKWTCCAGKC